MTNSDYLRQARALIAKPEKWTQGALARNAQGNGVLESNEQAVAFCAVGAMYKVGANKRAFIYLQQVVGGDMGHFNNTFGHQAVLDAFDKAIALAERDEEIS